MIHLMTANSKHEIPYFFVPGNVTRSSRAIARASVFTESPPDNMPLAQYVGNMCAKESANTFSKNCHINCIFHRTVEKIREFDYDEDHDEDFLKSSS